MPIRMRKLNQDEAAKAFPRRGEMDLSEYVDALAALQPGDAAAMELGDLTARAAKRRLGQAANRLGHRLLGARDGHVGRVFPGAGQRQAADSETCRRQRLRQVPPRSLSSRYPGGNTNA